MDYIPLLYLKNRKIYTEKQTRYTNLAQALENIDEDKEIYLFDLDGIENNKPNLCLFQKMSKKNNIWVDSGPRNVGDIVDLILSGATNVTIRRNLLPIEEIHSIKELTENKMYTTINLKNEKQRSNRLTMPPEINGLVIFPYKRKIEIDFQLEDFVKNICNKYKVYIAERNKKNISYWKKIGAAGLLLDLKIYQEKVN